MIDFLIAAMLQGCVEKSPPQEITMLTIIDGRSTLRMDSRTETAILLTEAIDFLDPCPEHRLLNLEDTRMLLRAKPKDRRETWRNVRMNYDDYTREAIEAAADYVGFWVIPPDEPVTPPTKDEPASPPIEEPEDGSKLL